MPVETYEDDEEEQEGPRSSFATYLAEGDTLFKQSELKKLWNLTVWYDVAFIVLYINQKKSNDFMLLNIAAQYVL